MHLVDVVRRIQEQERRSVLRLDVKLEGVAVQRYIGTELGPQGLRSLFFDLYGVDSSVPRRTREPPLTELRDGGAIGRAGIDQDMEIVLGLEPNRTKPGWATDWTGLGSTRRGQ